MRQLLRRALLGSASKGARRLAGARRARSALGCALAWWIRGASSFALVVVLAGFELLAAGRANRELHAMAALFARASLVGRRAVVNLQAPERRELALAACMCTIAGMGAFEPAVAVTAAEPARV